MQNSATIANAVKKKLAIISTYNENCGNASYTHVLKNGFSHYVDVTVLGLDLFLLQSKSPAVVPAGDRHIKDIARQLQQYDFVNIQFEAGLFGSRIPDMLRRIKILIDAAPNLTLTMHRVEYDSNSAWTAIRAGIATRSYKQFRVVRGASRFSDLTRHVISHCKKAAKRKNVWIKVHTRRDRRVIQEIYDFHNVFDFPLSFLTPDEIAAARRHDDRDAFLAKYGFEPGDKVVGLFGYLSNYKGIETAIEALALLPEDYKLGLFGSQHPQTVKRGMAVSPYLESLFDLIEDIDKEKYKRTRRIAAVERLLRGKQTADEAAAARRQSLYERFSDRIRFIGSLPDPEFIEALRLTDAVVLPYQEVGQSMSGVAVLAMEASARVICSNNLSFAETNRYFKDCYVGFDLGNSYELAQKAQFCVAKPDLVERWDERQKAFASYNIKNNIRAQLQRFGFTDFQD